jgi:hypothetical protein
MELVKTVPVPTRIVKEHGFDHFTIEFRYKDKVLAIAKNGANVHVVNPSEEGDLWDSVSMLLWITGSMENRFPKYPDSKAEQDILEIYLNIIGPLMRLIYSMK